MKKILGLLFCMLMIATALPIVDAANVQFTWCVKEDIYSEYYQVNQANTGVIGIRIVAKVSEVNNPNNLLGGVIQIDELFREPLNQDILWDNGLPHGYYAFSSQYKPTPQISREVVADVYAPKPWVVTGGDFRIIINYVGGPQAITGVNVFFYKNQDDNTPSMIRYAERTATFVGTYTGNNYFDMPEVLMNVSFDSVTLAPGKWWICFQPVIDWDMYWLASNLTGLGCYMSWPDEGYPKWTDDNNIPPFNEDVDVSFRLFGYITSQPPNPPTITGPTKVKTNVKNDYMLNAIDPDGDDVSYFVDWGDGTNSSWTSPSASGVNVTLSHAWTAKGTYTIKAKVKDIYNAESDRTTLVVSVPKIKSIDSLFRQFLQSHLNLFQVLQKIIQRLGLQ